MAFGHGRDRQRRRQRRDDRGDAHPEDARTSSSIARSASALWGGEEQGLLGSRAYVKAHFADPGTMQLKPEHAKLSGYFNLDNGSGKIRGVYLQGNEAMRPIFEQWLAPFRDLGVPRSPSAIPAARITVVRRGRAAGLPVHPGSARLRHSHAPHQHGHLDHAVPADLMQASAVIASVVYQAANRPERLPRRELPKAETASKPSDDRR